MMPVILLPAVCVLYFLLGLKKIRPMERGVILRKGKRSNCALGPGIVWVAPLLGKLERISIERFAVSLPPQSAITNDEIPIQLQSSFDAIVIDPGLAATKVRDWRLFLISQLQDLLKEGMEQLGFDNLEQVFPDWTEVIRNQLDKKAAEIGTRITLLQISNLSPRSKPA
jgi:regulator of protease activity HflC (stomatin/prohibitin superfamily)